MKKILFAILLGIISFGCKGQEVNFNFDIDFEKCIVIDSTFNDFSELERLEKLADHKFIVEFDSIIVNNLEYDSSFVYFYRDILRNKAIVFYPQYITTYYKEPLEISTERFENKNYYSNDYFYLSDTLCFFYYEDLFYVSYKKNIDFLDVWYIETDFEVYKQGEKIREIYDVKVGVGINKELNCFDFGGGSIRDNVRGFCFDYNRIL